jgi:hypothetical protein
LIYEPIGLSSHLPACLANNSRNRGFRSIDDAADFFFDQKYFLGHVRCDENANAVTTIPWAAISFKWLLYCTTRGDREHFRTAIFAVPKLDVASLSSQSASLSSQSAANPTDLAKWHLILQI